MNLYNKIIASIMEKYGDHGTIYLATIGIDGNPNIRPIHAYYNANSFYVVTNERSEKVREIEKNPNVALSREGLRAWGVAENLGHPTAPENIDLRRLLHKQCEMYKQRFDPKQETACILEIALDNAVYVYNGVEYLVDCKKETATKE